MQNERSQFGGMLVRVIASVKDGRHRFSPGRRPFRSAETPRLGRLTQGPGPWHHNGPGRDSVADAARRAKAGLPGGRGRIAVRGKDRDERPGGACPAPVLAAGSGR